MQKDFTMNYNLTINSTDDLHSVAHEFLNAIGEHRLVAFFGKMGVGKTTFIKAICEVLGVTDVVNSPTFSIINEYDYEGERIFHFDFYRLKKAEEAYDFGIEEYFASGCFCLMEWSENIESILPDECLRVTIIENKNGSRNVSFNI